MTGTGTPSSPVSSVSFRSRIWCPDAAIPAAPGGSSEAGGQRGRSGGCQPCAGPRRWAPTLVPGPAAGGASVAASPRRRHDPRRVPGRTLPRAWPRPEPEPATTVQRSSQGPSPRQIGRPGMGSCLFQQEPFKFHLFSRRTGPAFSVQEGGGVGGVTGD